MSQPRLVISGSSNAQPVPPEPKDITKIRITYKHRDVDHSTWVPSSVMPGRYDRQGYEAQSKTWNDLVRAMRLFRETEIHVF